MGRQQEILLAYIKHFSTKVQQPKKYSENLYITNLHSLSLQEYITARSLICKAEHSACTECSSMLQIATNITANGHCRLSDSFKKAFPSVTYKTELARRKVLQMPLVCIRLKEPNGHLIWYLFEYIEGTDYHHFSNFVQTVVAVKSSFEVNKPSIQKEEVKGLLQLAQSDKERELIRYAIYKSSGISSTAARRIFGFENMVSREKSVQQAIDDLRAIHEAIDDLTTLQNKAVLESLGVADMGSSSSSSESDENDADHTKEETSLRLDFLIDLPLVDIANQAMWNFFEIASNIESNFSIDRLELNHVVDSLYSAIECKATTETERQLLQSSFRAFLAIQNMDVENMRLARVMNNEIVTDSEPDDEADYKIDSEIVKEMISKRLKSIKRKNQRRKAKMIAERNFLSRNVNRKVYGIMKDYPEIGKEIETFVTNRSVGADAWRRTGVLTFDGNQRAVKEKVTYESIRQHLEETYKRRFAYGTVVQLCVARNRRRRSASNYKGVAKVTTRRARKGFSLKYNPDAHWSAAFYKGLNWLQYSDGSDIANINRDDASGFRLNTLTTHSQHPSPVVQGKPIITTRTDYVSTYPSVLQTTSYNFAETPSSPEMCAGIVKAAKIFPKNPAQHYTDLKMLQNSITSPFINPETKMPKKIECVRVDGAGDEGPSHLEVQYYWTKRHLEQGSTATLVTTRSSGSSYLNRVELQNGCLALTHSNLFIPSTLKGSCRKSNGEFCEKKLMENLDAATDVYIERCNGAPCGHTKIQLMKGSDSSHLQKLRKDLLIFLKSKKGREKLQKEKPNLYDEFSLVWSLRSRHMVDFLPSYYMFYLLPCYSKECPHPVCREGRPSSELTWFKNGPPISYLPLPVADKSRPWGHNCNKCSTCFGHYMDPKEAVSHSADYSPPPSEDIYKFFKEVPHENRSQQAAKALSMKVLLPLEDVTMWLDHLTTVQLNRRKGATKAAETRRMNNKRNGRCEKETDESNVSDCEAEDDEEGGLELADKLESEDMAGLIKVGDVEKKRSESREGWQNELDDNKDTEHENEIEKGIEQYESEVVKNGKEGRKQKIKELGKKKQAEENEKTSNVADGGKGNCGRMSASKDVTKWRKTNISGKEIGIEMEKGMKQIEPEVAKIGKKQKIKERGKKKQVEEKCNVKESNGVGVSRKMKYAKRKMKQVDNGTMMTEPVIGSENKCGKSGNREEEFWCSVCSIKYTEKTDLEELWIECGVCLNWFHTSCVGIDENLIPEIFTCSTCS